MAEAQPSKLRRAADGKATEAAPTRFAAAAAGARPFMPWRIPRLDLDVVITLVSNNRAEEIEAAVFSRMRDLGLDLNRTTEPTFEMARARRYCAEAFLDPTTKLPIGTPAEWSDLIDPDVIGDCWRAYGDLRTAYDPVAQPLPADEILLIAAAVKKNSAMLLRSFGCAKLAAYLLTTAEQQSNSPDPRSGSGESQPTKSPSDLESPQLEPPST